MRSFTWRATRRPRPPPPRNGGAALGTQVVGSTLRPASYCGCIGFKPTFGALNRSGSFDHLSQSCLGILAATPEDAWSVASAIVTRVGGDPGHPGLRGPAD